MQKLLSSFILSLVLANSLQAQIVRAGTFTGRRDFLTTDLPATITVPVTGAGWSCQCSGTSNIVGPYYSASYILMQLSPPRIYNTFGQTVPYKYLFDSLYQETSHTETSITFTKNDISQCQLYMKAFHPGYNLQKSEWVVKISRRADLYYSPAFGNPEVVATNSSQLYNYRLVSLGNFSAVLQSPDSAKVLRWSTSAGPQRLYQEYSNGGVGNQFDSAKNRSSNISDKGFQVKYPGSTKWADFNNTWQEIWAKYDPFSPGIFVFRGYVKPYTDTFFTPEVSYVHNPSRKVANNSTHFFTLMSTYTPGDTLDFATANNNLSFIYANEFLVRKPVMIRGFNGNATPVHIKFINNTGKRMFNIATGVRCILENLSFSSSGNSTLDGGAIINNGSLEIKGCTFNGNTGKKGGAIYSQGTNFSMINSTVSGNTADKGGGLFLEGGAVSSIKNSTIVLNTALTSFGGIYVNTNEGFRIFSSIVAKNVAPLDEFLQRPPDMGQENYILSTSGNINSSDGYNLFGTSPGMMIAFNGTGTMGGTFFDPLDPQIGPLAANNATNRPFTHALSGCGSPAINSGSSTLSTDQRGLPNNGQRDIGAFERQASGEATVPKVHTVTNKNASGAGSLKDIVENLTCVGDTVRFASSLEGAIINLTSILTPNQNVVIDGQDKKITISANNGQRILEVGNKTVFLNNLTLTGVNRNGSGGAFSVLNGGKLTLQGCLVYNNKVNQRGGVLYLINGATLNVHNSTFSGNEAGEMGGALFVDGGTLNVENSTIAFNKTTTASSNGSGGGAIAVSTAAGSANLTFKNSIIAKNTSFTTGQDILQQVSRINQSAGSHNIFGIIEPGVSGTIPLRTNDASGTLATPLDPKLFNLQDNGGPTKTHAISCLGPAKNTGLYVSTPGNYISSSAPVDQRQFTRVAPNDKGAFEDVLSAATFSNREIADSSIINVAFLGDFYSQNSFYEAYTNVCEGGTISAADSAFFYSASLWFYKSYRTRIEPNKPIIISKNITVDFRDASLITEPGPSGNTAPGQRSVFRVTNGKTLTIKNANVDGNFLVSNLGGFAFVEPTSKIVFDNCRFSNFRADTGGVVYGGKITTVNCQFDSDSAAIGNVFYSTDSVVIKGCTFTNNNRNGHVVYLNGANAKMQIGLSVLGDNSNFTSTNGRDIFRNGAASISTLGYNLVSNCNGGAWGISSDFDGVFSKFPVDLEPVSSVTKGTTYRPACNSRALNSGVPSAVGLTKDINGITRVNDRGAHERGVVRYVTNISTSASTFGSLPYVVANSCDSVIFVSELSNQGIQANNIHLNKALYITSRGQNVSLIGFKGSQYGAANPVFIADSVSGANITLENLNFSTAASTHPEAVAILSNAFGATLKIKNCTFNGCFSNTSNYAVSGRNMVIERCTFANNFITPVNLKTGCLINSSTIRGNTSTGLAGGVIFSGNSNTIGNSIIAGNQFGSGGADIYNNNFTGINGAYNFIGAYLPAKGFTSSAGDTTGTPSARINPKLDTVLRYNRGTGYTRTLALTDTSSCINSGDPNILTLKDQRGYPVIGRADRGAFEYAAVCDSITNTFTNNIMSNSAVLNFTPTNASHYSIRYKIADSVVWSYTTVFAPQVSKLITGLQTNRDYVWQIRSLCWGGVDSAAYSAENYFTTGCNLPDSVWLVLTDTNRLVFRWTNMINNSGYRIRLYNSDDTLQAPIVVTVPAGDTTYIFTGLAPKTNYRFTINTLCSTDSSTTLTYLAVTDSSYVPFLRVISPDSPQVYLTCISRKIEWEGKGMSNNFKIEVSYNNGATYSILNPNYPVTDFNYVYNWAPPSYDSVKCFVRITDLANPLITDVNNSAFTIKNIPRQPQFADTLFRTCPSSVKKLTLVFDSLHGFYSTYSWTLPPGFTGSSDSSSIFITSGAQDTAGVIEVKAISSCGTQSPSLFIPITNKLYVWTGAVSFHWSNPANWSCNQVPGPNNDVVIPSQFTVNWPPAIYPNHYSTNQPFSAIIGRLTIQHNGILSMLPNSTLNVKQHMKLEGNARFETYPSGATVTIRSN